MTAHIHIIDDTNEDDDLDGLSVQELIDIIRKLRKKNSRGRIAEGDYQVTIDSPSPKFILGSETVPYETPPVDTDTGTFHPTRKWIYRK